MTDREQSLQNKILFQKELIELKTKAIKDLEKENAELKEKLEITDLALDNCLKDSKVEK